MQAAVSGPNVGATHIRNRGCVVHTSDVVREADPVVRGELKQDQSKMHSSSYHIYPIETRRQK